ncbi:ubiquinone biosynthesis monooxygenase coq6-like [Stylonychia lemnae]|uniref:Ubiquinone biosynthesis monooxygenase coq6-like n=1 Tax=Stylonychia lemnae TaxID=5949 RepID=A0A078AA69_STYLE|nr:ubiquinone biosynthesis monooxygenase coq6-like [Stylonychia lemnae]|eukprot:CDW77713.1 ubiquinone biosynthesis monooxygenase coq6-like [Stylonychia lemnae]
MFFSQAKSQTIPNLQSQQTQKEIQDTDVLIVGGGIAGASLACALSSSQYFDTKDHSSQKLKKIVLLDHTKLPSMSAYREDSQNLSKDKRIPEPRVITLSPNSLRFLRSIGVLQKCNQKFITEFHDMLVYEEMGNAYMRFGSQNRQQSSMIQFQEYLMKNLLFNEEQRQVFEESQSHMGASVENNHLLAGLVERTQELNKCQILQRKVVKIEVPKSQSEKPIVELDDGTLIRAKLVIGSDGEKSKVREEFGIRASGYSYGQNGLVCTVRTIRPNTIAYQRFLRTGPLALLPLWDNHSSIVWSCPPELSKDLIDVSEDKFVELLNQALQKSSDHSLMGQIPDRVLKRNTFELPPIIDKLETKRFAFPLSLLQSENLAAQRVALIGDAAHRVHPLAGQGMNIGLTGVAYLANQVVQAKKCGLDIGDYGNVLSDYERKENINAKMMISSIEFVKASYSGRIYGSERIADSTLGVLRNVFIDLIQTSNIAKYNFMNYASGNLNHPITYEWQKN